MKHKPDLILYLLLSVIIGIICSWIYLVICTSKEYYEPKPTEPIVINSTVSIVVIEAVKAS